MNVYRNADQFDLSSKKNMIIKQPFRNTSTYILIVLYVIEQYA